MAFLNSSPTPVLVDPQAVHSFINTKLVETHRLTKHRMTQPMLVTLHDGEEKEKFLCPGVELKIRE